MRTIRSLCLCLMAVVAVCQAGATRFRHQQRQQFGRQELAEQDATNEGGPYPAAGTRPGRQFPLPTEAETPADDGSVEDGEFDGPYAAAGWRPAGRRLRLPPASAFQRQQQLPNQVYGAPEPTATSTDLGELETEASEAGETNETTDEPESELLPGAQLTANLKATTGQQQQRLQSLAKFERLQQLAPVAQSSNVYYGNAAYFQLPVAQQRAQPLNAGNLAVYPVDGSFGAVPVAAKLQQVAAVQRAQLQAQPWATANLAVYPVGGPFVAAPTAAKLQQVVSVGQPELVSVQQQQQPQFLYSSLVASPDAVSYSSQYQSSW